MEQFKIDSHFANLSRSKLTLLVFFYWLWASQLFCRVCTKHCIAKNNPTPLPLTKKQAGKSYFIMIQSVGTKNWIPLSINRPQRFTLLFLYLTHLFWFVQQNEICMMRIKTQSFTWPAKYWWNFVDSITKSCIYNPIKSLWWSFFCKNS